MSWLFGNPPTPEEIEEYKRLQEQARMHYDVTVHALQRFFDELSEDDAAIMKVFLQTVREAENPQAILQFYMGILTHKMSRDYGICIAHGVNHEKEMSADMAAGTGTLDREQKVDDLPADPFTDDAGAGSEPPTVYAGPDAPDHDPSQDMCICRHMRISHTDGICWSCNSIESYHQFVLASTT